MGENVRVQLNSAQRRTIRALLSQTSIAAAATVAGISERTIYRWLADGVFRQALTEAESQAIDTAARRLVVLAEKALDRIESLVDNADKDETKLRAATAILENMLRLTELRSIEQRLSALEKTVHENN